MREPLDKFMEDLGVGRILSPYETQPWMHYDEEQGISCSAEVRMGPGGDDVEAEIQFLYDDPDEIEQQIRDTESEDEDDDDEEDGDKEPQIKRIIIDGREQVMIMKLLPVVDDKWSPKTLTVRGKDFANKLGDWEKKGCDFFRACVEALNMGELPDIDELMEEQLRDDSFFGGGRRGRVGRKSPKIKPAQLMGMKQGGGGP